MKILLSFLFDYYNDWTICSDICYDDRQLKYLYNYGCLSRVGVGRVAEVSGLKWVEWAGQSSNLQLVFFVRRLRLCLCRISECLWSSQSHVATDGQSVRPSWCRAPSGAHDQILVTVRQLRFCRCEAPSLTRIMQQECGLCEFCSELLVNAWISVS
jgi:hypothetical protein